MSTPREIAEYVPGYDRVWRPVGRESAMCECGHLHFPRVPSDNERLAPQWTFCEGVRCECRTLRRGGVR